MTIEESLWGFEPIFKLAKDHGLYVRATMSTALGCPFEGEVPEKKVVELARRLVDMGADEIGLGDTTGMANPLQVQSLLAALDAEGPFDLVLCRNLAFTYFVTGQQMEVLAGIRARLVAGGALVIGGHERLPEGAGDLIPWPGAPCVWRK